IVSLNTGNAGPDVKGAFTSQGYNLIGIGDFASGFNGPADQIGTTAAPIDPKLATLQNNGGPTDTVALLPGSPAQDAGKSFGLTMDQRGMTRPHDHLLVGNASGGDASEIGAFETTGVLFVTTLDDHNDGECDTLDCTLREALSEASSQPGAVIAFKPGLSGIIQLTAPLSTLQTAVSITGPGSNVITVRRNTGGNYRIFTISNGATINISGLTIANGMAPGGGPFPADAGGAILNLFGTLNISRCAFVQNQANFGGAIMNMMTGAENSTVTVGESTFTGNAASDGAGGAIYNYATGSGSTATATLTNCTLSGNTAGAGAALYNYSGQSGGSTVTLLNCTIANNSAEGGSVTNSNFAGSTVIFMRNSLFKTGATGPNFFNDAATFTSLGNNLSNDTAGGPAGTAPGGFLNASGDIRNTDPLLAALGNNGGTTLTHALLAGSAAINAGHTASAPKQDQRGWLRNGASDIGAFEFNGIDLRIISITRSASNIIITFTGVAGRTFRLERRLNVSGSSWQPVSGVADLTPSATGNAQFTDPNALDFGKAFYRVSLIQ
ncbi:MAG TPA: CSLREA domain-containing protein, partial [Chthoniobacterales bacterium]|nr:CSLREA domain-containing protein [Chthoniobacterales bacterium]